MPELGWIRVKFGRVRAKLDRIWARFGPHRSNLVGAGKLMVEVGPTSPEVSQLQTKFGRNRFTFGRNRAKSVRGGCRHCGGAHLCWAQACPGAERAQACPGPRTGGTWAQACPGAEKAARTASGQTRQRRSVPAIRTNPQRSSLCRRRWNAIHPFSGKRRCADAAAPKRPRPCRARARSSSGTCP